MCLAVPAKVMTKVVMSPVQIEGKVDFGAGVIKTVNFSFVPDVAIGDDVLVHAGVAIQKLPSEEAAVRRSLFSKIVSETSDDAANLSK